MLNQQLTDIFNEMADIMEILAEDRFRIATYRKVARVIKDSAGDIAELLAQEKLESLAGIGKASAAKIAEFAEGGKISVHEDLRARIPGGLLDLLKIGGMGPKGVAAVWQGLGVESIPDLQKSIDDKSLETLAGFGAKKAEAISKGIAFLQTAQGRIHLHHALAIAEAVTGALRRLSGVQAIELAGSLRRCCETIGDIDILVQASEGREVVEGFTRIVGVKAVLAAGETKASIRYHNPDVCSWPAQIDLRIVSGLSMGAAWQYFTGSKAHNVRLREIAVRKKLKLNEYGLFKGDKRIAGKTEAQIYKKLGMQYIPPTLREDRGEVELALDNQLPVVVAPEDIRGDLHMHTPASDGRSEMEDMAAAARQLGYQYIAITDHSRSSAIAGGLEIDRLVQHVQKIQQFNQSLDDITVLAGSEVDILMGGSLDYPDEVLAELEFVIASVHSGLGGSSAKNTRRVLRAMENPYVNCIAHPSGRLINRRAPMELDMGAIIAQAVKTGTALEINANPHRLDLKDIHCRQAVEAGAKLVINTDAHDVRGLHQLRYGIATAQRGGVSKSQVLNTHSVEKVREWVARKRSELG